MTKILLIDAQGTWLKQAAHEPDQVVLPLGLMSLAAYAREKIPGLEFRIFHSMVDFDNEEAAIARMLREEKPDVVGIRGMTRYRAEFERVARLARENTKALLVGGGPFVSSDPLAGLDTGIDVAVLDEGEATFTELLERFRAGQPLDGLAGSARLVEGKAQKAPKRPFFTDEELDAHPFPAYDLVDQEKYLRHLTYGFNRRKQGVIYSSRGCPFRCDFCHVLFGKQFRSRSAGSLFREFRYLYHDLGIRDFYVVDDIFNLQKERAVELFRLLAGSELGGNIRIYFVNGLRGDRVDEEFLDAAVAAGTVWIAFAIETAVARLQKQIQKNLNVEKVRRAIEYASQKGVAVVYWGLLGIDGESIDEARATVELMNSLPPSTIPMLFSLKPYPGTEAYRKIQEKRSLTEEEMKLLFDDTTNSYHSFAGLLRRDDKYYEVLRAWMDHVQSPAYMKSSLRSLIRIGHSDAEIEEAYGLLYRKLPPAELRALLTECHAEERPLAGAGVS